MYCKNCGKSVDGKFCPDCGAPTQEKQIETAPDTQPFNVMTPETPKKQKKKLPSWGVIAIVLAVFVLLMSVAFQDIGMALGMTAMVGFFVYIVGLIISAIKKKSVKPFAIGIAACAVLFIVGMSSSDSEPSDNGMTTTSPSSTVTTTQTKTEAETKAKTTQKSKPKETYTVQTPDEELEKVYKKNCSKVAYKEIARNPDKYTGQQVKYTGKVSQVIESTWGTSVTLLVNVTKDEYGFYDDAIYVNYTPSSSGEGRVLEEDIITIYGEFEGLTSYTSVLGAKITVPQVSAQYIDINS